MKCVWRWRIRHWARRGALLVFAILILLPLGLTLAHRVLPVPATPLMAIRLLEGDGLSQDWVALADIAPAAPLAVIAGEDNTFCQHSGFDWREARIAWAEWRSGGRLRGASTLSMQTARNLYLWPGGGVFRKGMEAIYTGMIETLWPKRRIMEVYLNIAEWGPGVFGISAAARHHFGVTPAELTPEQAALLAAVLPNPRRWSASRPTEYITGRAAMLRSRAEQVRPLVDCL